MSNSIVDAFASLDLTPTYLLVIGALIGYFRHQHVGKKVPGSLSIPKDLLKSTEFNKLWTLLYVVLLPLSWLVNVFAHAVYALLWLIDTIGAVVRWSADKLYWLWNEIVLGLGGFSFYVLWHYLVKWPYLLFSTMLSTFFESFNWTAYKSTYRTVAIASLIGVSGFLLEDIVHIEMLEFSKITIVIGVIWLLDAVGTHMANAMGVNSKGMRPTYAALILTAILVFVIEQLAQDHLMFNQAAGLLGGIVLGVSVATWVYGIIVMAAFVQFLSLLVPAYLETEGAFDWLSALRSSFATRWLKSIASIVLFVLAYNTLGLWVYNNIQQIAAEPYNEYLTAVENRKSANEKAMGEAQADLAGAMAALELNKTDLDAAFASIRSLEAGDAFWSSIPLVLRDVVYMDVSKPFDVDEETILSAKNSLARHDSITTEKLADYDRAIEDAMTNLNKAQSELNRISSTGITASEDGRIEYGESMRFGMPVPNDADNLKWRITNDEGDTIVKRTGQVFSHRFTSGSFVVHAAPVNGCGTGQWSSYSVSVNDSPEAPLRLGEPRGNDEVCAGDEVTYVAPSGMDIYVWNVPSDAEVIESKKNTAKIKWGKTSGDVSVYGELDGEKSNTSTLYVKVSAAPGASLNNEGTAGNEDYTPAEIIQDDFAVLAEEGDALVANAQSVLEAIQAEKNSFELNSSNQSTLLGAKLMDLEKRASSNTLHMIMNWLGKAMFLFVACLLLAVALNFLVLWTSTYFGKLYNLNQEGSTYFRSSLASYQEQYAGFPYLGIFVLIVVVLLGAAIGYAVMDDLANTLQNGAFPTLMEMINS